MLFRGLGLLCYFERMQHFFLIDIISYVLAVVQSTGTTFQTGQDIIVRAQFINNGVLPNTQDTNFRAVQDDWPVFAFAKDLGTVSAASSPVVFVVGHVRDPAIEYIIAGGKTQNRSLYFWSQFSSVGAAVSALYVRGVWSDTDRGLDRYRPS
jgi:hypothetical protein